MRMVRYVFQVVGGEKRKDISNSVSPTLMGSVGEWGLCGGCY